MQVAVVNYWAVLAAAVAAWILGAVWYMALAKPWLAALGKTEAEIKSHQGKPSSYVPFVLSFVAELVMAWALAGILAHIGAVTIRGGVIAGAFCWLGFVLTTMAVNNAFGMRKAMLTVIDAGHWLAVLVVMGAIIGAFGVAPR